MKKIQAWFIAGAMFFLVIGIPTYISYRIWEAVGGFAASVGFRVFKNPIANTAVYLSAFAAATCLVGAIFKFKLFRKFFDWFTEKLPVVSTIAKFIPNHEELEALTGDGVKEVVFLFSRDPEIWVRGLATKPWYVKGQKWVRIYRATSPTPFTGYCDFEMPWKDEVIRYTGRTAAEYSAMIMSYGIRSDENKPAKS